MSGRLSPGRNEEVMRIFVAWSVTNVTAAISHGRTE
jgi:hypothetical protein